MSRSARLLVLTLFASGCGAKPDEGGGGGGTGSRPTGSLPGDGNRAGAAGQGSDVGRWVPVGDFAIRIDSASVGRPMIHTYVADGEQEADANVLVLEISVANSSKTLKLEYGRPYSVVTDEHGNEYGSKDFAFADRVNGHPGRGTVYPGGEAVKDTLCFQPPVSAAKNLRLTLKPFWGPKGGTVEFRLPAPSKK